jgi:hypothetical protein
MALITSAASGNFSAGATWTGGVVPGVGDEARASNGHTITIDVDATCDEVSNAGTGLFILADGVTLTANVTAKSTTVTRNVVQFTSASPAVGFIVGDVTGATVSGITGAVNNTSSGTLTITGNVTGGSAGNAFGCNNASTGTLTITGNATGGSATQRLRLQQRLHRHAHHHWQRDWREWGQRLRLQQRLHRHAHHHWQRDWREWDQPPSAATTTPPAR